jgi:Cyanate permease
MCLHILLMSTFVALPGQLASAGFPAAEHWKIYLVTMLISFVSVVPFIIYAEVKRKMKRVFVGCVAVLLIAEIVLWGSGPHFWELVAGVQLFFLAFNLMEALLPSLISKESPAGYKGTAMGIYSTSQFIGVAIGGAFGGWVDGLFDSQTVFLAGALLAMVWLLVASTMRCTTQIEEAVVYAATATHQHVAGNARIEPAGDQRQHVFLSADRETANTFVTAFDQQQAIVFDLQIHGHVRVSQTYARSFHVLVKTAANVTFHFNRAELVLATTFHAHAEGFTFDLVAVLYQRFLEDVVHIAERNIFHFQNMMNTRNTGQRVANILTFVFVFRANFNVIPVTHHGKRFVVVL